MKICSMIAPFVLPVICIVLFIIAFKLRYSAKFDKLFYVFMVLFSITAPAYFVIWLLPKIGIVFTNDAVQNIIIFALFLFLMSNAQRIENIIIYHDLPEFDIAVREYIFSNVSDPHEAESICGDLLPIVNDMLYKQYVRAPKPNHDLPQVMLVVMNCCFVKLNDSPHGGYSDTYAEIAKKCLQSFHDSGFIKDYSFEEYVQNIDRRYHLYQIYRNSLSKEILFN